MPHKSEKNRGRKRRKRAFFRRSPSFSANRVMRGGGFGFAPPVFDAATFIRSFITRFGGKR